MNSRMANTQKANHEKNCWHRRSKKSLFSEKQGGEEEGIGKSEEEGKGKSVGEGGEGGEEEEEEKTEKEEAQEKEEEEIEKRKKKSKKRQEKEKEQEICASFKCQFFDRSPTTKDH